MLTLHARRLNIVELKVFQADGVSEVPIINYSLYSPTDMLTVYLVDDANVGAELILHVQYGFAMNDQLTNTNLYLAGFYRTSYTAADGSTRYVGAAHLVHTYARTIMPCYDEPLFTSVFKLRITHDASYQAVSNTQGTRRPK
jgi:aminopeptidase N